MGVGLLAGGVMLLILLAGGGGGENGDKPVDPTRKKIGKVKLPASDEELANMRGFICQCWAEVGPGATAAKIRDCALFKLHPGEAWPAQTGDDQTAIQLQKMISDMAAEMLASGNPTEWCQQTNDPKPTIEILPDFLSQPGDPKPGTFYPISKDETLGNIARKALNSVVSKSGQDEAYGGDGKGGSRRIEYIHCIASGPQWNVPVYGTTDTSSGHPAHYQINGIGLRRAFNPWHEDAKAAIIQKRFPARGVTPSGQKIGGVGSSYALIWLPPIDPAALGEFGVVTCAHAPWSDGSSSIDPPPEILSQLV